MFFLYYVLYGFTFAKVKTRIAACFEGIILTGPGSVGL